MIQHISMISEDHVTLKSNDTENTALITEINYSLNYYIILYINKISNY